MTRAPEPEDERLALLKRKLLVDEDLQALKAELINAKRNFARGGRPASRLWMEESEARIRSLQAESQECLIRLAELKARRRAANMARDVAMADAGNDAAKVAAALRLRDELRWERAFLESARALLDRDTYEKIVRCTQDAVGVAAPEVQS